MRPRILLVRSIETALRTVETAAAAADLDRAMGDNVLRNFLPPRRYVSPLALRISETHETGHAQSAIVSGWPVTRLFVRPDGTGNCMCERPNATDYASTLDLVRFLLAGHAAELRHPYASGHVSPSSFDIISARLTLDDLNARAIGPRVTFTEAAAAAVLFVDEHARAISNVALALGSCGEMDDYEVRLFGRCGA